ncbi:DUF4239 domain-containing protein [Desulfovibrio aminophilus]|nr:DUF4239 domain-containing protein [Desulfovibrio aminophilus]
MSPEAWNIIALVAAALAGTLGAFLIRRRRPHGLDPLQKNLLATNIGYFATLYTFFLSFAVMTLWNNFTDTSEDLAHESYTTVILAREAQVLPHSEPFVRALEAYLDSVAREEWVAMSQDRRSPATQERYDALWREWERLRPDDAVKTMYHVRMLEELKDLSRYRHARLEQVRGSLLWPFWLLIHLGFVFTLVALFYTDLGHGVADVWYMGMMLLLVLINIWLIRELDTPFSGVLRLGPERFLDSLARIRALAGH